MQDPPAALSGRLLDELQDHVTLGRRRQTSRQVPAHIRRLLLQAHVCHTFFADCAVRCRRCFSWFSCGDQCVRGCAFVVFPRLPKYTSEEILREKLTYAINHATTMQLDFKMDTGDGFEDLEERK